MPSSKENDHFFKNRIELKSTMTLKKGKNEKKVKHRINPNEMEPKKNYRKIE